jgi:hypothetical protein
MKLDFSRQIFKKKTANVKFRDNSSSRSRIVPFEQTEMTKPVVDFRNFADAPKSHFARGFMRV